MSLIITPSHSELDLRAWDVVRREAEATAKTQEYRRLVDEATSAILSFGGGYLGVSWGKDSVVVADLVARCQTGSPMVWVRLDPLHNPECQTVRDAFLSRYAGLEYLEIPVQCTWDGEAWRPPKGKGGRSSSAGFDEAVRLYGDRHISGVRGDESSARMLAVRRWGCATDRTCRPLAHWTSIHVFAYLIEHDLPIHPAYGYTMDGVLNIMQLRVACLGGHRGDGMGRKEWEARYYRERLAEIRRMGAAL